MCLRIRIGISSDVVVVLKHHWKIIILLLSIALQHAICLFISEPYDGRIEPPIKDFPRKGHCMLDLSIGDTVPKTIILYSYRFYTLRTSKRGQPLDKGQKS